MKDKNFILTDTLTGTDTITLNTNPSFFKNTNTNFYEVMHMEKVVAMISSIGKAEIINEKFMPYDLYLEKEENDMDIENRERLFLLKISIYMIIL